MDRLSSNYYTALQKNNPVPSLIMGAIIVVLIILMAVNFEYVLKQTEYKKDRTALLNIGCVSQGVTEKTEAFKCLDGSIWKLPVIK